MPTYQYACSECGHEFEAVQSFSDASLTECPVCNGRLRKVFGAVGIVFKGSGFYRNDSRDKKPAAVEAKSDSSKADAKTDSKADAKVETKKSDSSASKNSGSTKPAASKSTSSSTKDSAA